LSVPEGLHNAGLRKLQISSHLIFQLSYFDQLLPFSVSLKNVSVFPDTLKCYFTDGTSANVRFDKLHIFDLEGVSGPIIESGQEKRPYTRVVDIFEIIRPRNNEIEFVRYPEEDILREFYMLGKYMFDFLPGNFVCGMSYGWEDDLERAEDFDASTLRLIARPLLVDAGCLATHSTLQPVMRDVEIFDQAEMIEETAHIKSHLGTTLEQVLSGT